MLTSLSVLSNDADFFFVTGHMLSYRLLCVFVLVISDLVGSLSADMDLTR